MLRQHPLSVLDLIHGICDLYPNNIAVEDGLQTLTYRQLDQRSASLALRLQQCGATPSQVIPILTNSCQDMVVGILGILKAGCVYVPIDIDQWPHERIQNVLQRTSSGLIVCTDDIGPQPGTIFVRVDSVEEDHMLDSDLVLPQVKVAELAAIIFTSGTTGVPKGVEIKHEAVANFVTAPHFNYDVTPDDRVLLVLSIAFDACMGTLFSILCNGGSVVLANRSSLQHQSRRCSVLVATPSILAALEAPRSYGDYPYLDRIVMGGETPSQRLLDSWSVIQRPMWIAYGPTESFCATLTGKLQKCDDTQLFRSTMLGGVIRGATVSVVDDRGVSIDALHKEGELYISGVGLARGYWKDDARTRERFVSHDGKRQYRTGDFARWSLDDRGQRMIEFCGRRDRTVKIRGFLANLELDVDAAVLSMEPSLTASHSVIVGDYLYTAISPVPDDVNDLRQRWMAKVPHYLVPARFIGLDMLPMTPNGKIDPNKLADIVKQTIARDEKEADAGMEHADDITSALVMSTAHVLGIPKSSVDLKQSFIAQGLHSLAAVKLSASCRKRGFAVPVDVILTAPSIEAIADVSNNLQSMHIDDKIAVCQTSFPSSAPLTMLQKMLIYNSLQHKSVNVVQHMATYRTVDIPRLLLAWHTVAQAEPIFQTRLDLDAGWQHIDEETRFDWMELYVASQDEMKRRQMDAAATVGLGTSLTVLHCEGPELPADQSIVILSIHHALIDGFSASLLLSKVSAAIDGRPIEPSPPFTLAVERLTQHAAETTIDAQAYWQEQEERFPDAVSEILPSKRPFYSSEGYAEHTVRTGLDVSILSKCAEPSGTTPAAYHFAAWALLLASYTNSESVMFGAVVSARLLGFEGADRIIGPMISTQPLRLAIDRSESSSKFVQQMFHTLQSVAKFQATERKLEQPRYQSALAIQYDSPEQEAETMKSLGPATVIENPDLPLSVLVEGDDRIRFIYNRRLFASEEIEQMADVYRNLLRALALSRDSIGQCLSLRLAPDMIRKLLERGNIDSAITRTPLPGPSSWPTVADLFLQACKDNNERVALEKNGVQITYSDLFRSVSRVAGVVERLTSRGDVVCVVADRSCNWIIGACAIVLAGAVYCPIDSSHTLEYRSELIVRSSATLLLHTDARQAETLITDGPLALSIDQLLASSVQSSTSSPRLPHARDGAFLCFTSGSTGKPKGVLCEHGGVTAFHSDLSVRLNSAPGVRIAQFLSPGFDGCVHEVFATLCYGGTLVLRKTAEDVVGHLGSVDVAMTTPSVAAGLDPSDYPNLKCLYFAGEAVQQAVLDRWAPGRTLYNLFGPTEGTIGACQQKLQYGVPANVGPPVASTRLYIVDDLNALVPPGAVGNIFIAGIQVSRGYIKMPEQNAKNFIPDPFCGDGRERMYRTGDLGFWDADGNVHVCGRRDRQIKMRGYRIDLDDVGGIATRATPKVRKAVATEHQGKVVLWLEPELGEVEIRELRRHLQAALPFYAVPKRIISMPQLPLSRNGKLGAAELARQLACTESERKSPVNGGERDVKDSRSVLTSWEAMVAEQWRLLLELDPSVPLSPDDSFTDMGGHSILQLRLTAHLRKACRIPLSAREMIQARTLADMAIAVERLVESKALPPNSKPKQQHISLLGESKPSPAELEWWHRYQRAKSQCTFNVPWVAELQPGAVDVPRLRDAFNAVLVRHPVLRSRFHSRGPCQAIRVLSEEPIRVKSMSHLDAISFVNRPFDLSNEPLARIAISPSTLAINISHIICDLTSLQVLLSEVATLYHGSALPPVEKDYFSSSTWEQPLEPEAANFWSTNFDGLQLQRQENDVRWRKSYNGTSLLSTLPEQLRQDIVQVTASMGLTLHQFALAASAAVLHAVCGRNDVVLGSPYTNRTSVEEQNIVGLFLQALPVRVKVGENLTSAEVLTAVREASQGSLAHAIPWNRLLAHLSLPFPSERQQLFDSVVTFHDDRTTDRSIFPVDGVSPQHCWTEGSKFGLLFEWHAFTDRISLRLEYDTDRVPSSLIRTIQGMLLVAVERLLVPSFGYDDLIQELDGVLHKQCVVFGDNVEEMRAIAAQHLRGV